MLAAVIPLLAPLNFCFAIFTALMWRLLSPLSVLWWLLECMDWLPDWSKWRMFQILKSKKRALKYALFVSIGILSFAYGLYLYICLNDYYMRAKAQCQIAQNQMDEVCSDPKKADRLDMHDKCLNAIELLRIGPEKFAIKMLIVRHLFPCGEGGCAALIESFSGRILWNLGFLLAILLAALWFLFGLLMRKREHDERLKQTHLPSFATGVRDKAE
jgi:hypothetical protein